MSCASLMMQGTTSDAVEQSLNWQTMTEILQESHHA